MDGSVNGQQYIKGVQAMTDNEICREYREAKNKKAQIQILADQMLCTRGEIIKILAENGEDVSQINTKAQVRRKKEEPVPESVLVALCNRLDEIDNTVMQLTGEKRLIEERIKEKEQEYREIAEFLKSCTVSERSK